MNISVWTLTVFCMISAALIGPHEQLANPLFQIMGNCHSELATPENLSKDRQANSRDTGVPLPRSFAQGLEQLQSLWGSLDPSHLSSEVTHDYERVSFLIQQLAVNVSINKRGDALELFGFLQEIITVKNALFFQWALTELKNLDAPLSLESASKASEQSINSFNRARMADQRLILLLQSSFYALSVLELSIKEALWQQIEKNPALVRSVVLHLNHESPRIVNEAVDWLLGIHKERLEMEEKPDTAELTERFPGEFLLYARTPYELARDFLAALNLQPGDVLYDLGAGYGSFLFWAAYTTEAGRLKGSELAPEKATAGNNIARRLRLTRVELIQGNVRDMDLGDGTVFYLFEPFSHATLVIVVEKLSKIAQTKSIRIVSWGRHVTSRFREESWLAEVHRVATNSSPVVIFRSAFPADQPEYLAEAI